MSWEPFDPYPDYPALQSWRAGKLLVQVRAYMLGQHRLQVSVDVQGFWSILSPEL